MALKFAGKENRSSTFQVQRVCTVATQTTTSSRKSSAVPSVKLQDGLKVLSIGCVLRWTKWTARRCMHKR